LGVTLPATITLTGSVPNAALIPLGGEVTFTPSIAQTDAGGNPVVCPITSSAAEVMIAPVPVPAELNRGAFSIDLVPTDTPGLNPSPWYYSVTWDIPNIPNYTALYSIPTSADPVDLSQLTPLVTPTPANLAAFLQLSGGIMAGALVPAVVALSFSSMVAVNAGTGNDFTLTLTGSATIQTPTNPAAGQAISFALQQDSTGSRTVTWGGGYDFGSAGAPALSTGANKVDVVGFRYHAGLGRWLCLGFAGGY
jgi:hypothetical protein